MTIDKKKFLTFLINSIILGLLFVPTAHNPFFWDKDIIDSVQAHWLLESNFNFHFPNSIDTGHPPFIPTMLAILWTIFGKNLFIGHFFIFLFALGAAWQIIRFVKFFTSGRYLFFISLLVLLDATFLAQSILVSGDIVLVFFFFLALNSLLRNQNVMLCLGLTGLCIVSMRGLMSGLIVFLFHLYYLFSNKRLNIKQLYTLLPVYIIPLILPIGYYLYHYQLKGWIGYHQDSPWAGSFHPTSLKTIYRNLIILGWRLVDFGKIFLWIFTVIIVIKKGKSLLKWENPIHLLLVLFLVTLLINALPMMIYEQLAGHRYLLPSYLVFATLTGVLLFHYVDRYKWVVYSLLLIGLLSGNFWIYPEKIAQGWDASLAHLPYYHLKEELLIYLEKEDITLEEVGAVTPNKSPLKYIHLNSIESSFAKLNLDSNKYVFYSNIMNDYSDNEIDSLNKNWILKTSFEKRGVFIKLFKNPKYK